MENSIKKRIPAGFFVLTLLASIGAEFVPLLYLIVPAMFAAILIRSGSPRVSLPLFAPCIIFVFILTGGPSQNGSFLTLLCMVLMEILAGIVIWQCQSRKKGGFSSAFFASAVCIAGLYCAICLPGILSGEGAFTAVQKSITETGTFLRQMLLSVSTPETQEVVEQYLAAFDAYSKSVPVLLVPMICIFGCVLGLSNTLFFYLFTEKQAEELGIRRIRPFREWTIPKNLSSGMLILLLGSLALRIFQADSYAAVSATVTTLIGFPLFIQGICLIDFLIFRSKGRHAMKRVILYCIVGILLPVVSSMMVLLGCFEQVFRIREKLAQSGSGFSSNPFGGHKDE